MLIPRLLAHGVNLDHCCLLDDRLWSFPHDRTALQTALRAHGADLLWIDPIDSYCGECSENDGAGVRGALESLARVARELPITIIAARHPGKLPGNFCPGSRQWRAVPREIVELRHDPGPPARRLLRCRKDPHGRNPVPRAFALEGRAGEPRVFTLGEEVAEQLADTLGVGDIVDRWKIDEAVDLVTALLCDAEQEAVWVYAEAERQRLSERTVRYAARRLGVLYRREGSGKEHRCFWRLPGTPATPAD